ncbi:MAG: phosphoribosylformylglycinamidine synthase subunit PurS [Myxococcales bacterium]|nr:phosphoribosylformylglycinamidine synthase subunit PurS [Myxococcales bacterium]
MKVKVYVTLKAGVLDPQGQAVGRTLERMGFAGVTGVRIGVRIGKYIELDVADGTPRAALEEMCRGLLANPVIEDFRIEDFRSDG